MAELNLPDDLQEFLQEGKQLQYDASQVEYGALQMKGLSELELIPLNVNL